MMKGERMMKWMLGVAAAIFFIAGSNVWAAEEESKAKAVSDVVVTATRTELSTDKIPNAVTVIAADDIEQKGHETLYDVLKDVPGLAFKQCGGAGQYSTIRMRGGLDRHIKLLINGIAVGDQATGTTPHYDLWNMLSTDDIERIEIIRGAQSALYGADAVSGVINIITKQGKGEPKFFLKSMAGSLDTLRASGGVSGEQNGIRYSLTAAHNQTGDVLPDNESESDSVTANFGYAFSDTTDLSFHLKYSDSMVNLGQTSSTLWKQYNDPNAYRHGYLFFSSMAFSQQPTAFWDHKITLGYDRISKHHDDPDDGVLDVADNINDSLSQAEYLGITQKAYWQNNFTLGEIDRLTAGFEYEGVDVDRDHRTARSRKVYGDEINTQSVYLQNQLFLLDGALTVITGGRFDDHSSFGNHFTYSLGATYVVANTGTKLKASFGTGFAAPSIFQLYDPTYGTADLQPEESENWEAGFEQRLFGGKAMFEAVYFHNDFEDLIAYDYTTMHYKNRDTFESYGVETSLILFPVDRVTVTLSYTYTDGEEDEKDLANVPKNDFKFGISYNPGKYRLSANLYYVGDRLAYDQKEEHRIDAYTLVNVAGAYNVNDHVTLFAQIDNLFDEDYQSAAPYEQPGICAYSGLKLTF